MSFITFDFFIDKIRKEIPEDPFPEVDCQRC